VVGQEETPQHPTSDLAPVGVCLFTPVVHEAVRPPRRGEPKITDAFPWLLDQGRDGCVVATRRTETARWYRTHRFRWEPLVRQAEPPRV
jgi:dTDP-glucose pyrophosphorylase